MTMIFINAGHESQPRCSAVWKTLPLFICAGRSGQRSMAADETNDRRSLDTGPTFSLIRSLIADRRIREASGCIFVEGIRNFITARSRVLDGGWSNPHARESGHTHELGLRCRCRRLLFSGRWRGRLPPAGRARKHGRDIRIASRTHRRDEPPPMDTKEWRPGDRRLTRRRRVVQPNTLRRSSSASE
jgi:hypothetical protein